MALTPDSPLWASGVSGILKKKKAGGRVTYQIQWVSGGTEWVEEEDLEEEGYVTMLDDFEEERKACVTVNPVRTRPEKEPRPISIPILCPWNLYAPAAPPPAPYHPTNVYEPAQEVQREVTWNSVFYEKKSKTKLLQAPEEKQINQKVAKFVKELRSAAPIDLPHGMLGDPYEVFPNGFMKEIERVFEKDTNSWYYSYPTHVFNVLRRDRLAEFLSRHNKARLKMVFHDHESVANFGKIVSTGRYLPEYGGFTASTPSAPMGATFAMTLVCAAVADRNKRKSNQRWGHFGETQEFVPVFLVTFTRLWVTSFTKIPATPPCVPVYHNGFPTSL